LPTNRRGDRRRRADADRTGTPSARRSTALGAVLGIGSTSPGKGTKVQTNTLQKYLDHGDHLSIKSPP
jgi:hypothetical protein